MTRRRFLSPIVEFLQTEAAGGVALLAATVIALVWANSPWSETYGDLWHTELTIGAGALRVSEDLQHWVNDALMAVFFFVVGLEIKRETSVGELRDRRAAALPALAAAGGMILPVVIYLALAGGGDARSGWGIPMATDIAFAVGVLIVLGPRVPAGLKVFLLAVAIIDDIGAIAVIAIFYSGGLSLAWLAGAAATLAAVPFASRLGLRTPLAYVPFAVVAWFSLYQAGVHPTIAGVALGLLTPAHPVDGRPVLEELEHRIHPWSSFVIIPVFALANAGVPLTGAALADAATSRVTWAIAVALVAGKVLGVTGATIVGVRTRLGRLPLAVGDGHVLGVAGLAGIGFTVSLFITSLAFESTELQAQAKIGILAGSLVSALFGAAVLVTRRIPPPAATEDEALSTV